jgi:hypothetical protein
MEIPGQISAEIDSNLKNFMHRELMPKLRESHDGVCSLRALSKGTEVTLHRQ